MAKGRGLGLIILVCLLGALVGAVVGQILATIFPGIAPVFELGLDLSFDIHLIKAGIKFNIASILGIALALLVWRKL